MPDRAAAAVAAQARGPAVRRSDSHARHRQGRPARRAAARRRRGRGGGVMIDVILLLIVFALGVGDRRSRLAASTGSAATIESLRLRVARRGNARSPSRCVEGPFQQPARSDGCSPDLPPKGGSYGIKQEGSSEASAFRFAVASTQIAVASAQIPAVSASDSRSFRLQAEGAADEHASRSRPGSAARWLLYIGIVAIVIGVGLLREARDRQPVDRGDRPRASRAASSDSC